MSHNRLQAWCGSDWLAQLQNKHTGIHRERARLQAERSMEEQIDYIVSRPLKPSHTPAYWFIPNNRVSRKQNHPKVNYAFPLCTELSAIYQNTVLQQKSSLKVTKVLF